MRKLDGKTAIVTGANSGMGMATVEALSDEGATVIMLCRDEKRGREALAKLSEVNSNLFFRHPWREHVRQYSLPLMIP